MGPGLRPILCLLRGSPLYRDLTFFYSFFLFIFFYTQDFIPLPVHLPTIPHPLPPPHKKCPYLPVQHPTRPLNSLGLQSLKCQVHLKTKMGKWTAEWAADKNYQAENNQSRHLHIVLSVMKTQQRTITFLLVLSSFQIIFIRNVYQYSNPK